MSKLCHNEVFLVKVTAVRRETRLEKKKLAMAMRLKQLGALGMSVCIHHYLSTPFIHYDDDYPCSNVYLHGVII